MAQEKKKKSICNSFFLTTVFDLSIDYISYLKKLTQVNHKTTVTKQMIPALCLVKT